MPKYLLPCKCGKGVAIDASQAGQQIACECGNLLDVPTLRGVRALEPAPETISPSRPAAEWDSMRGAIFAASFILLVVGAAVTFLGYDGLRATPNITREAEAETFDKAIDDLSLDEAYEAWKGLRENGLGERGSNVYVNMRSFRAGRQRLLATGVALCVGGLLGAIGAMLGRRKSTA